MQTNTKTKLLLGLLSGIVLMPLFGVRPVVAASLSSSLSSFTLSEDPGASNHETKFNITLSPEPTDQVSTTFTTNGECLIGPNFLNYATGGVIVTQNGSLPIGLRAFNDTDGEGPHVCDISFSSQSTHDPEYSSAVVLNYSIQITDDDIKKSYNFSLSTLTSARLQEGDTFVEQYQIDISEKPIKDVTVSAVVDDQCDFLIGVPEQRSKSASAVFAKNTTKPIIFTLIPSQDSEFEGIHQCTVAHSVNTADANYQGIAIQNYSATIVDDEQNPNIPDEREYEEGLIYYRDANYDGIDDVDQPNVQSFINPNTNTRQAVMITDGVGMLLEQCSFVGDATVVVFDGTESIIESSQGQLNTEVSCSDTVDYHLVWILDKYIEHADDWVLYDAAVRGSYTQLDFDAIVFNLGADFTSALVIEGLKFGGVQVVQSNAQNADVPADFEESLAASVANSRLNPLAIISFMGALGTVGWVVYRQFFSNVDTKKSSYPRIDRF